MKLCILVKHIIKGHQSSRISNQHESLITASG
nr:MAG TPA: hypothetical protein [Caudoviricetes sp.]